MSDINDLGRCLERCAFLLWKSLNGDHKALLENGEDAVREAITELKFIEYPLDEWVEQLEE